MPEILGRATRVGYALQPAGPRFAPRVELPHTDREESGSFALGIQSATRFAWHHEVHRAYLSGLFAWRGRMREDSEEVFRNTLMFESTIWSLTEIWLFASGYVLALLDAGDTVVEVQARGLSGRRLGAAVTDQDF